MKKRSLSEMGKKRGMAVSRRTAKKKGKGMRKSRTKKTEPFVFYECMTLLQSTGKQARDVNQLMMLMKEVEPSVIYHHMHEYYLNTLVDVPEYPNDFSVWAAETLEDRALAEKLASLDVNACANIEEVRQALIHILQSYISENSTVRSLRKEGAFFFNDASTIVIPTGTQAHNLSRFIDGLHQVGSSSIYFHFFEARMRLNRPSDDFSAWLSQNLGRMDLARKIRKLDPYHYSMESLRQKLISLLQ